MPYKEKKVEKVYFQIGEVSKMLSESESCIRFWCNEFNISTKRRIGSNYRFFDQHRINQLRIIKFLLKTEGYTIPGANRQLLSNNWFLTPDGDILHKQRYFSKLIKI